MIKDAYWDIVAPTSLPFTIASQEYIPEYPEFSTKDVKVKHFEQDLIVPEYVSKVKMYLITYMNELLNFFSD